MSDNKKWERVVAKLVEDTKAGATIWRREDNLSRRRQDVVGAAYVTSVAGKTVGIFESTYRHYTDEDEYETRNMVTVEFLGKDHVAEWTFPETNIHWKLLESVRYQAAGADDFAAALLGETKAKE
jgi:hypothetical protein